MFVILLVCCQILSLGSLAKATTSTVVTLRTDNNTTIGNESVSTSIPITTNKPDSTSIPITTNKPDSTSIPITTNKPDSTSIPITTNKPDSTSIPNTSNRPDNTSITDTSNKPDNTSIADTSIDQDNSSITNTTNQSVNDSNSANATTENIFTPTTRITTTAVRSSKPTQGLSSESGSPNTVEKSLLGVTGGILVLVATFLLVIFARASCSSDSKRFKEIVLADEEKKNSTNREPRPDV